MDIEQCPKKSMFVQILLGLIVNFTSLAPSMTLGFPPIALSSLLAESNSHKLDEDQAFWVATVAVIAAPIGCLIAGLVSDRYGRKSLLVSVNLVCGVGWVEIVIAYYAEEYQYPLLLLGLVVTGISAGLASISAAVYMAEVSTPKLRGMFIMWNQLFFTIGVLMVYGLGWLMEENWGLTAAITIVFPSLGLLGVMLCVVESPQWLLSKNYQEGAKEVLKKLYNKQNCDDTIFGEIERLSDDEISTSRFSFNYFARSSFSNPFILITIYFAFQRLSGVLVMPAYDINVLKVIKVTDAPYVAINLSVCVLGAAVASIFSLRFGRRSLSLVSGAGSTLTITALAVYLVLLKEKKVDIAWLHLTLLMVYSFISTVGFQTIPFGMAAEVFPRKVRGVATGLSTCIAYTFNLVMVIVYPKMVRTMGDYTLYLFFGGVSLLGTIFIVAFLPETKDKTLEEIEKYFDKKISICSDSSTYREGTADL